MQSRSTIIPATEPIEARPSPRRRRWRLTVRLWMAIIAVVAVLVGDWIVKTRTQREAVWSVLGSGGQVDYDCDYPDGDPFRGGRFYQHRLVVPGTLVDWMGINWFATPVRVELRAPYITPEELVDAVDRLRPLDRLQIISIECSPISVEAMKRIAGFQQLRLLQIEGGGCEAQPGALAGLGGSPVEELELTVSFLGGGPGLAALRDLAHLKELVWGGDLTDVDMAGLERFPRLESISLVDRGNVTLEGLLQLRTVPTLRSLTFLNGECSPEEVAQLAAAMPSCHVGLTP